MYDLVLVSYNCITSYYILMAPLLEMYVVRRGPVMFITYVCDFAFHTSWCTDFGPVLCCWFIRGTSDESLIQKGGSGMSHDSEEGDH